MIRSEYLVPVRTIFDGLEYGSGTTNFIHAHMYLYTCMSQNLSWRWILTKGSVQIQHKLSCILAYVVFAVFGWGSWLTLWCVHFNDMLSLSSPETLTLKGLSWCVSVADESGSDPLEQWVTTLPNVHKHTYRKLDISGSATVKSQRKSCFFKYYFQYIKVLHLWQSLVFSYVCDSRGTLSAVPGMPVPKPGRFSSLKIKAFFTFVHSYTKVRVRFLSAHRKRMFCL